MQAAIIVARELLRCRLAEGGRDALLERVAELLDAACRGAAPFCTMPMPQVVPGARVGPRRARVPPGARRGLEGVNTARSTAYPTSTVPPPGEASSGGPSWGRAGTPPRSRQGLAPGSVATT